VEAAMMNKILYTALAVLLPALFFFTGCAAAVKTTSAGEGFAIYLTKGDVPVSEMEKPSHVEIADAPVISGDDIIAYYWDTHEIQLTAASYERVMGLKVPVNGKSFVVCVDKEPVYWGAFWTPVSSISFSGIVINVMPNFAIATPDNTIKLELGYPGPDFSQGGDRRINPLVKAALEKAGKLK
jgi:hypothetical protein